MALAGALRIGVLGSRPGETLALPHRRGGKAPNAGHRKTDGCDTVALDSLLRGNDESSEPSLGFHRPLSRAQHAVRAGNGIKHRASSPPRAYSRFTREPVHPPPAD